MTDSRHLEHLEENTFPWNFYRIKWIGVQKRNSAHEKIQDNDTTAKQKKYAYNIATLDGQCIN